MREISGSFDEGQGHFLVGEVLDVVHHCENRVLFMLHCIYDVFAVHLVLLGNNVIVRERWRFLESVKRESKLMQVQSNIVLLHFINDIFGEVREEARLLILDPLDRSETVEYDIVKCGDFILSFDD